MSYRTLMSSKRRREIDTGSLYRYSNYDRNDIDDVTRRETTEPETPEISCPTLDVQAGQPTPAVRRLHLLAWQMRASATVAPSCAYSIGSGRGAVGATGRWVLHSTGEVAGAPMMPDEKSRHFFGFRAVSEAL